MRQMFVIQDDCNYGPPGLFTLGVFSSVREAKEKVQYYWPDVCKKYRWRGNTLKVGKRRNGRWRYVRVMELKPVKEAN